LCGRISIEATMKFFIPLGAAALLLASCSKQKPLVNQQYTDSLIRHYTLPATVSDNQADMLFWQSRIDPQNPQQINEARYAGTLVTRFHQFGEINDIKKADRIYNGISTTYHHQLASAEAALASTAMLQHRFADAQLLLDSAVKLGMETYNRNTLSFDVSFELGHYNGARYYLAQLKPFRDYNYYFRRAKYDHLQGQTDSALAAIGHAVKLAKGPYLKAIALSNQGDLYIHIGEMGKAFAAYQEAERLNSTDLHTILGLGWIALVYDHDPAVANQFFHLALSKNKLPDPLFKLYQAAQMSGSKLLERRYAAAFAAAATDPKYGIMYHKYLIEIYTGVLQQPGKAEQLAKAELLNRATPQTQAWLAYALYKNNKKREAFRIYEQNVAGRPLEGLELFYIGNLLKGLGKGYDADKYLDAALQDQYDLSPSMVAVLTKKQGI
jgi:tetratricopeptide (TPR) repeat protein